MFLSSPFIFIPFICSLFLFILIKAENPPSAVGHLLLPTAHILSLPAQLPQPYPFAVFFFFSPRTPPVSRTSSSPSPFSSSRGARSAHGPHARGVIARAHGLRAIHVALAPLLIFPFPLVQGTSQIASSRAPISPSVPPCASERELQIRSRGRAFRHR